ncbi:Crp/Fnr family transcriptional regulator [uncultured Clostridium sp.]|uniref:Crp/Fnr family transcriptional regulator n=1 Tax=uncultured Clostridium sp. TaxID=59620 RepID=UPI00260B9C17|nr:Crp/Fnr family transcriptional regulator [uncultured Clostridium sp.]
MVDIEELKKIAMLRTSKKSTLMKLSLYGDKIKVKKGEHIFRDKEIINNIYILISGKVALYKFSESSYKKIIFILGPDEILNEVLIDDLPASVSCEVFEDCELISINKFDFLDIMEGDFELTKIVLNGLSRKLRRTYRQIKNSTPLKIEKRIAAKLWKLSKDYGVMEERGCRINIKISVTYLSEMFGMPRETVSRGVNTLVKQGLIIKDNKDIIVVDRDKLSEYFKGV